jgi:hypothetical protein
MSLNSAVHHLLDVLHGDHSISARDEAVSNLVAESGWKPTIATTAVPEPGGATLPVHHEDKAAAVVRGPEDGTEPAAAPKKRKARAKAKPAAKTPPAATPVQSGQVAAK